MAIARIGSVAVTNGTSAGQNTSGSTFFVCVNGSNAATSPTDSVNGGAGNTWVKVNEKTGGGFSGTYAIWYVNNPLTHGSNHTFSGGGSLNGACFAWYSGTDTTSALDQQCSALAGGASPISCASALTPSNAGALTIAGIGGPHGTGLTISAGLTIRESINGAGGVSYGAFLADLESTAASPIQPAWDNTSHDAPLMLLAIFNPGAGGTAFLARPGLQVRQAVNRAGTF